MTHGPIDILGYALHNPFLAETSGYALPCRSKMSAKKRSVRMLLIRTRSDYYNLYFFLHFWRVSCHSHRVIAECRAYQF